MLNRNSKKLFGRKASVMVLAFMMLVLAIVPAAAMADSSIGGGRHLR
jgi:hypothetical protein